MENALLKKNFKDQLDFLENQLATSPENGKFLCGRNLSAADIIMIYPLESARGRGGFTEEKYPKLWAYVDQIHEMDSFKHSIKRVEDATGETFNMAF